MSSVQTLLLREQFSNPQQQRDSSTLGMWIFMATEVMFFGGLFAAYAIYRMYYTRGFEEGAEGMTLLIGSINTVVLMTSCLTMSLAIRAISQNKQAQTYWMLILTNLLGVLFLVLKFTEYIQHYHEHKAPGVWFISHKPEAGAEQMFFVFYFAMTGLHAIHMTIGIGLVTAIAVRTAMGRFNAEYHTPVSIVGLYWHFVDIIWTFLYVIFYIPGFH